MSRSSYLTQSLQTRCVGGSVSTYRQHSEVMGALNWAINSIWLGPAWGSISHDGSWKMLHYRLRHVFRPLLLSFVQQPASGLASATGLPHSEVGAGRGGPATNAGCPAGSSCVHLSNHLPSAVRRSCTLHVRSFKTGESQHQEPFTASASAGPSGAIATKFPTADLLRKAGCTVAGACWLTADCQDQDQSEGKVIPSVEEASHFPTPLAKSLLHPLHVVVTVSEVQGRLSQGSVSFTASVNTTAPYTFFSSTLPGVFSDNSMTLRPGTTVSLAFTPRTGSPLPTAAAFRQATRVYTMNNKAPQHL
jgi:hypothetical protein